MLRRTAYLASAVALIAVGVGVKQACFRDVRRTVLDDTNQPGLPADPFTTISRAEPVTPLLHRPSERRSISGSTGQPRESPTGESSAAGHGTVFLTGTSHQSKVTEPNTPPTIDAEASDPADVIGHPFPVSASVEASCRGLGSSCDEHLEGILSQFAQEPRDPAWAKEMEAKLRDQVMTAEPDKFSIRAIECRTTLCVVEVASLQGPYRAAPYAFVRSNNLFNGSAMYGYESNEYQAMITVTLRTFVRR